MTDNFSQGYQGWLYFETRYPWENHELLVMVPCRIAGPTRATPALFDPGSEWCVLSVPMAQRLELLDSPSDIIVSLHSRLGRIDGWLERLSVEFAAEEGTPLSVQATWFVSPDWPGPTVLGWSGCLERFRFALDPSESRFFFGEA